nr:hypothetical conserved protein [uncultured Gammaproteobacteria bacterium]
MLYGADFSVPAVLIHPHVALDSLSRDELRAIFAMRRRTWPDGTPIQVFVLPDDHPLHRAFCKQVLNVYPHQLRRIWDRGVFSGTGQAPIEVSSVEEMQKRIAAVPGAIGYTDRIQQDASVKAITVR